MMTALNDERRATSRSLLGADLLQPRKPDRFREVVGGGSIRIGRLRVAFAA
jgi:hypothetical protein